jgi:putative ATP-binding cassette transporter
MFASVLFFMSGVLTMTVVLYAAFGSAMVLWLGKDLPGINFNQVKTEADLRSRLQEAKQNADSLAMYRGEEVAKEQAESGLNNVMGTLYQLMNVNCRISLFTNMYNQLMPLIPAAIIAYLFIKGKPGLEFGQIGQAGVAFTYVFNGLTFLIAQYGGISNFRAVTNRLGAFWETLNEMGTEQLPPGQYIEVIEGDHIEFDKLTVLNGYLEKKPILSEFSFKVDGNLLITGPNGAGKGQFARALARMWPYGSGKLILPPANQIMFLSREPYLPTVTLRKLLVFGCCEQPSDERLQQVLDMVELRELVTKAGGFDTVQSWKQVLSLEEQQRLSLARIVLVRPKYAVVDQATSALEQEIEDLLYAVLTTIGTLAISTSTGAELASKHKWVLELSGAGDGEAKLYPADQYKKPGWKRFLGLR